MRIAYADPPYPGCAKRYIDQVDYAGEINYDKLMDQLATFDGWILHTHVPGLRMMERRWLLPENGIRICQWVKPFAAFKANIPIAYAYEPVIVKAVREPEVTNRIVYRDWIAEPITLQRGLVGAKPERVCHWAFELVGAQIGDELVDLFPGTGAVARAWQTWRRQLEMAV